MSWLNIVSVAFLMCVLPNLDKANMDLNPTTAQTEFGTSESMKMLIQDLVVSLR